MPTATISTDELQRNAWNRLRHGRLILTATSKVTGEHITLRIHGKNREIQSRYCNLEDAKIVAIDAGRLVKARNKKGDEVEKYERGTGVAWLFANDLRTADGSWAIEIRPNTDREPARLWLACQVINWMTGRAPLSDKMDIILSDNCARCGRVISDPESKVRGVGPECWGKVTSSQHTRRGQ
jgi:hypothetical protein